MDEAREELYQEYYERYGGKCISFKVRQELNALLNEPKRKLVGEIKSDRLSNSADNYQTSWNSRRIGKKKQTIVIYGERDLMQRAEEFARVKTREIEFNNASIEKANKINGVAVGELEDPNQDWFKIFMENNIDMLQENLKNPMKTYGKQLIEEPPKEAILLRRSRERLKKYYEKYIEFCNGSDDVERKFWAGQSYLEKAYNGGLDKIGCYTTYLLLTYTNMSLSEVSKLTGVSTSGLSRVRNRQRWLEIHTPWFFTEKEKTHAIKEFRAVAVKKATVYDLQMKAPVNKRKNKKS